MTTNFIKQLFGKTLATLIAAYLFVQVYPILFQPIPVQAATSLSASLSVDKSTAAPGDTLTYTATLTNNGDQGLNNVLVTEQLAANTTYQSGSGSATKGGGTVSIVDNWLNTGVNLGALAVGQTVTVTWRATVNAGTANATVLTNNISATTDEITSARTASTPTTVAIATHPAMSPNKSADKTTAATGETVNYTLTVRNSGDADLHDVMLVENLPQYLNYTNGSTHVVNNGVTLATPPDAWIGTSGTGMNVGTLVVGATVTATFRATIAGNAPTGTRIENTAQFKSNETPNWIQCAWSVTVTSPAGNPALSANKSADKTAVIRGDTVSYTLTARNSGSVDLHDVMFVENLPQYLNYTNGSTRVVNNGVTLATPPDAWIGTSGTGINVGTLVVGATVTVTFRATIDNSAPNGQRIENTAQFKSNETPNWIQCAWSVTVSVPANSPALTITKAADKSTVLRGDTVNYTIVVRNSGNTDLHNVLLTENIPQYLTYVAGSSRATKGGTTVTIVDAWIGSAGTGTNLGTLTVGQSATVTLQMTVNNDAPNGQTLTNTAQTKSDETPNWISAAYTVTVSVPTVTSTPGGTAALSITKKIRFANQEYLSVDAATYTFKAGDIITYRLFVGNSGNGDSGNLTIVDTLPNLVKWDSGDGSYDAGSNQVNFTVGILHAGSSVTLTYNVKINASLPPGTNSQQNTAVLYENNGEKGRASTFFWVGNPPSGQILGTQAPTRLPVSGGGLELLQLGGVLSLLGGGLGLKLRSVKMPRRIHVG